MTVATKMSDLKMSDNLLEASKRKLLLVFITEQPPEYITFRRKRKALSARIIIEIIIIP
jgi:hypothetical protein